MNEDEMKQDAPVWETSDEKMERIRNAVINVVMVSQTMLKELMAFRQRIEALEKKLEDDGK